MNVRDAEIRGHRRGWAAGYAHALRCVAANIGELELLGDGWRQAAAVTAANRLQARLDQMAEARDRMNANLGRPPGWDYRGGPVDWETGLPAGSACAWLRRTRRVRRVAA